MAETIITIDIATLIKAGLATALSSVTQTAPNGDVSSVTIRAEGVRDDTASWNEPVKLPCVAIRVSESYAQNFGQNNVKLREYPVAIQVATYFPDDPWQTALYTIGQAVGNWILTPATLSLTVTGATFRKFHLGEPPVRDETEDRVQRITWNVTVGIQKT